MTVDALFQQVERQVPPLILVRVMSELLDRSEREHLSCSYGAHHALYMFNKLEARRQRFWIDEIGWGYNRGERLVEMNIQDLTRRAAELRWKRYQAVCRQCHWCVARKKAWPPFTKFKSLSAF